MSIAADGHELHVAAGVLVDASGRVLIARRAVGKHMGGAWEFPGGKIVAGETPLQGLVRELHEELKITGNYTQRIVALLNDDTNEVGKVHLGVVHLFEMESDDIQAGEDALANLAWQPIEDLKGPLFEKLETWSQHCISSYTDIVGKA